MKKTFAFILFLFYCRVKYYQSSDTEKVSLECSGNVNYLGCTKASVVLKPMAKMTALYINCDDFDYQIYKLGSKYVSYYFSRYIVKVTPNGVEFCNVDLRFQGCYIKINQTTGGQYYESRSDTFNILLYGIDHKCDNYMNKDYKYKIVQFEDYRKIGISIHEIDILGNISSYNSIFICYPYSCELMKLITPLYRYSLNNNTLYIDFSFKDIVIKRKAKGIFAGFKIVLESKINQAGDIQYEIFEIMYKNLNLTEINDSNSVNINSFELENKPIACSVFTKLQNESQRYKVYRLRRDEDLNLTYIAPLYKYLIYNVYCVFTTNKHGREYLIFSRGFVHNHAQTRVTLETHVSKTALQQTTQIIDVKSKVKTDSNSTPIKVSTRSPSKIYTRDTSKGSTIVHRASPTLHSSKVPVISVKTYKPEIITIA